MKGTDFRAAAWRVLSASTAVGLLAAQPVFAQQVSEPPAPLPAEGTGQASASSANADRTKQVDAAQDQPAGAAADAAATTVGAVSQDPSAQDSTVDAKEIVVTGTSIRGVPPTGSNLIQLGSEAVVTTGASTTQELLSNVPQLGSFNTAPRPDQRSNGIISTAPNIRGIGQAQTLVLINGHRLVGVGQLQNIPDPSIVPPSAIQRVEIVADGASSIYGSDGIAGVVNVITRRDYDGVEGTIRRGFGDDYRTLDANAIVGKRWSGGGVMVTGEYARNSRLEAKDRDFLTTDFSDHGGRNQNGQGNACTPATYKYNTTATGGAYGDYYQPGTGLVNPTCPNYQFGDLYPRQQRLSFFAAGHQDITNGIEVYFDSFYSETRSDAKRPDSPLYTSGVMTRNNPFFPTGVPDDVPSITSYFNVNDIDGVPERDKQKISVYGGTFGVDVDLPHDFKWSTYLTGSRSRTDLREGGFNSSAVAQFINSSSPASAIDPFGGETSDTTKITLADWEQRYFSKQYIWELNSKIDGSLFHLPGGDVKVAIGGVYRNEYYDGLFLNGRIGFREGVGAADDLRKVYSGFGELFIPLFGADNELPFLRRLDISVSGRYDHYNDFGSTTNPKVGVNYSPVEGLTFRGSYSTSFHAPALPDLFGPDTRAGYVTNGLLPPGMPQGSVPGGIYIAGGNANLKPETSRSYSFGADFAPTGLPGLRASLTYYNIDFKGRVAYPNSSFFYVDPGFNQFFVSNIVCASGSYPTGSNCVSRPIDKAVVYNLIKGLNLQGFPNAINGPNDVPDIYSVTILRRANLAEIETQGLDYDLSYHWTMGAAVLGAEVEGNYVLKYGQRAIAGDVLLDQFPYGQERFKLRGQLSAKVGPLTAVGVLNFNGKYKSQYYRLDNTLDIETVSSYTTVDLHLGYDLPERGVLAGTSIDIDAQNLFDQDPPYMRSSNGYGVGDVLGRVVTFGVRKKF